MNPRKLRKIVRDIVEAAHPELRQQLAKETEALLQKELERVEEELAATTREAEEYWKALTGKELNGRLPELGAWERSKLAARKIAGVLFTIVDIPLGAWLWASALLIGVVTAFAVGALVSVGVAIATHMALLNFADDQERPLRSIRVCRSTALAASLVVLAAAFVLFFMRSASAEMGPLVALLILAVPGALWLASISLPVLAGALFAWARFQERPWWYRKKIEKLQRIIFDLQQALKKIASLRGGPDSPTPPATAGGGSGPAEPALVAVEKGRKIALPLALVICVLSVAAKVAHAQEASPQPVQIAQVQSQATAMVKPAIQGKSCEVWDDDSTSVNQDDRAEAVRRMNGLLSELTTALQCRRVRIGRFTDQGRFARFNEIEFPHPPTVDCTRTGSNYASVFKLFQDVENQKADQECSARRKDAERKFETERAAVLAAAQKILLNKDRKSQAQEKCTEIVGLLKARLEMAAGPTVILILTDAISDCQNQIPEIQIPPTVRVVFLLLPADPGRVSPGRVEDWLQKWATAVPEATMVPWVNLTPSWIRQMAQSPAVQVGAVHSGKQ